MELLNYPFMVRALIAAAITGLIAPAIGTYVVQRRLSLLGDGLGHVAIAGVGLALATGTAPLPVAVVICLAGAVVIELLRRFNRASGDVGLAILFYGGLAAGVLLAGVAGQGAGALAQYLFGSLATIAASELWLVAALGVVVLVPTLGLAPQLFAVSADEEQARTMGLRTSLYNLGVIILAAITVAIAMRTVGLLLISAMMVIPVATARSVTIGFRRGLLVAMAIGVGVAVSGTVGSFYLDAAPGGLIVVFAIGLFLLSLPLSLLLGRHRRRGIVDDVPAAVPGSFQVPGAPSERRKEHHT